MTFKYDPKFIRNFCIIAHIDHGKSTLADRLLELTNTVEKRLMTAQHLDNMDLERERGITIKARPVTMEYKAKDGNIYQFNLIDTPGHVDFAYEVSRSIAACEGALLVVDSVQGVQAQTLANVHLAIMRDLEILPIINKIDLPAANPDAVKNQIEEVIGIDASHAVMISAKSGLNVELVPEELITAFPPPKLMEDDVLRALIFDSHYDVYRGVMVYVRIVSGELKKGSVIRMMASDKVFEVIEVGTFTPEERPSDKLLPGEVGYLVANIKNTADVKVGDTITLDKFPAAEPLPGFKLIAPVVFAGIYPTDSSDFELLRDALNKLRLNDSALHVEQESSLALGFGFRCGFLGLLHLEIVFERLTREFNLEIIPTAPSVVYRLTLNSGEVITLDNPARYPDPSFIDFIEEPWVKVQIMAPPDYTGAIIGLCQEKRGEALSTETIGASQLLHTFLLPMNEIVTEFNDRLKSVTQGYGSFDYEPDNYVYRKSDIIKLEIRIHEEPVDAFSCLLHRSKAETKGRALCARLKEVVPPQLFKVAIQAAIGGKVIGRETISAMAKNVTAKCYGGDISRKRKLLEKQKKGKEKMKMYGKVNIPSSAFMEVLKND